MIDRGETVDGEPAAGSDTTDSTLPSVGRLAGVDYGAVRVGLAICDATQTWVTPFDTYTRRSERLDSFYFRDFAAAEQIAGWVIGLPIHLDGNESLKSIEARHFAQWLSQATHLPVRMFDERFTTAEARRLLFNTGLSPKKKKQRLDRLAAHLILTHYIEYQRDGLGGEPRVAPAAID